MMSDDKFQKEMRASAPTTTGIATVTSGAMRRHMVMTRFVPVGLSYLILVTVLLVGMHGLPLGPETRLAVPYLVQVIFLVWTIAWTLVVEQRSPAMWGLTTRRLAVAVVLNTLFALIQWVNLGALPGTPPWTALMPALISAAFETVYFYGWMQCRLQEHIGFTRSLILGALLYALYHVSYLGFSREGLDILALSLGLYAVVGMVNITLVRATGSLFVLWPFYLTAATLYDYHRLGLDLPWHAVPKAVLLIPVLGALAVGLFWPRRGREGEPELFPTVRMTPSLVHETARWLSQQPWRQLTRAGVILWAVLVGGLFIRYIINDPVTLETSQLMGPAMASRFLADRSAMAELSLRLGLAIYLAVPLFVLLTWLDRLGLSANQRTSQSRAYGAEVAGVAILNVGLVLGLMLLCLPVIILLSHQAGQSPRGDDLLRFGLVAVVAVLYTLLNSALVAILAYAAATRRWRWFTAWQVYVFVYNWWMIYPLFSQFNAVGLPGSDEPAILGQWMASVWQRASMLYSFVPQYHYYLGLTVTYLRDLLDPRFFLPSLVMLAEYAMVALLLAFSYAQGTFVVGQIGRGNEP
jgi:hypothetical protein